MSFILDALRKSEHERQKQVGPALAEVPAAAARPTGNAWATGAVILLLVNLLVIGVMLLRKPDAPAASAQKPAGTPASAQPRESADPIPAVAVSRAPPPPQLRPTAKAPVSRPTRNSLRDEVAPPDPPPPASPGVASEPPPGPAAVTRARGPGTVTYQSLEDIDPRQASGNATSTDQGLPKLDEMPAQGGLPDLQLQLHVYSNKPQDRFVFINGQKYRDGDTLKEGPLVEQITSEGVVLSSNGHRFVLSRD